MSLKKIAFFFLPLILPLSLIGCMPSSDNDSPSVNIANITEENQIGQNNNIDTGKLESKYINGMWRLAIGEANCQLSTTHTKLGKYYLASARSCPDPLHNIASWQIEEDKLFLYDKENTVIISLAKQAAEAGNDGLQLTGTLPDGTVVTMSR